MNKLEKQKIILTHRPSLKFNSLEALSEAELDRLLAHIQAQVAQRDAAQAHTDLVLVRDGGLRNIPSNFSIIKRLLGQYFTVAQFRQAIADSAFKNSLQWVAPPFQEAVQQEQETAASQERRRKTFSAVVGTLSTVNVADCDANYFACERQLQDLYASHAISEKSYVEDLTEALLSGYITGLVKNTEEKTQDIDRQNREQLVNRLVQEGRLNPQAQYAPAVKRKILSESTVSELRDRANILSEIADNFSPDRYQNSIQFCSLFASVKNTAEFRDQLDLVRERKRLAQLSPQQIREENARVRQVNDTISQSESDMTPDGLFKKLRPDSKWNGEFIDKGLLWRVSKEDVARLLKIYGKVQLDDRIRNGIPTAVAQEQ